jgi:hypothetical protein
MTSGACRATLADKDDATTNNAPMIPANKQMNVAIRFFQTADIASPPMLCIAIGQRSHYFAPRLPPLSADISTSHHRFQQRRILPVLRILCKFDHVGAQHAAPLPNYTGFSRDASCRVNYTTITQDDTIEVGEKFARNGSAHRRRANRRRN